MIQEKTKVVFLINSLAGGGAERMMTLLLEGMDRSRYDISLCLTCYDTIEYDLDASIPLHVPDLAAIKLNPALSAVIALLSLARCVLPPVGSASIGNRFREIRENLSQIYRGYLATRAYVDVVKPQVLVSFLFRSTIIALLLKRRSKGNLKVVASDHCTLTRELKRGFPLTSVLLPRLLFTDLDKYVAVSGGVRRDLMETYRLPVERISVIYNGSDVKRIRELADEPLAAETVRQMQQNDGFALINVGRLAPPKSHQVLLRAFQKVREQRRGRLYLVGQGELHEELKALVAELGLVEDVRFLGWQKNPFNIMKRCDLFVLSSSAEAFPNVLVEAMALGLPIVSTDCPTGPREALADGTYGDLVPMQDVDALAAAILRMLDDKTRRSEFAKLSRERAESFNVSSMVAGYEELLDEVATSR